MYFIVYLIFFNKKKKQDLDTKRRQDLESIIKSIEELSDEQREILKNFKKELETFVTDRSLESCIQTLNLSIQLSNIRERLLEIYKQYCNLLENELDVLLNMNREESERD